MSRRPHTDEGRSAAAATSPASAPAPSAPPSPAPPALGGASPSSADDVVEAVLAPAGAGNALDGLAARLEALDLTAADPARQAELDAELSAVMADIQRLARRLRLLDAAAAAFRLERAADALCEHPAVSAVPHILAFAEAAQSTTAVLSEALDVELHLVSQ